MMIPVFRRKSIIVDNTHTHQLKRRLSALELMFLGIGAIIGAGIFVITGEAAATKAGPAIALSFIMAALACGFAALCYAELSAMVPVAGSAYTYTYVTMGELMAWIIGWDLILEYGISSAVVAMGWGGYFCRFLEGFGLTIPVALTLDPFSGGIVNIPAMAIVLLTTLTFAFSVKIGSHSNGIVVILKLLIIALFLGVGIGYVKPDNWHPFMPFGWDGVMKGAAYIFFAYIGFDAVSTAAEEAKDPQKSVPFGILGSLLVCTILYIVVALVLTGMVPYQKLSVPDPVAYALAVVGVNWAAGIVSLGAIAGLTSVLLVMIFGQTRIFFAMSRDGLLPKSLSTLHPRYHSPTRLTLGTGFIIALVAGTMPMEEVTHLVNIGTLFAFLLVSLSVLLLRKSHPESHRPFSAPFMPWTSLMGMAFCAYLIVQLSALTLIVFLIWMAIGLVLYFSYGYRHSHLVKSD